ncbi:MAG: hypothetical protein AB1665_00985 [Candidatus Thermoplasmatota archaeon]
MSFPHGIGRRRAWNRKGAIEGLPLQLIIMIVIAGIAITILVAWLAPWKARVDLASLSVSPASVKAGANTQITVTAWDTAGNKLAGVNVEITGANIGTKVGTTDGSGVAKFTVNPALAPGQTSAKITVTGTYTGTIFVEKSTEVTVVP